MFEQDDTQDNKPPHVIPMQRRGSSAPQVSPECIRPDAAAEILRLTRERLADAATPEYDEDDDFSNEDPFDLFVSLLDIYGVPDAERLLHMYEMAEMGDEERIIRLQETVRAARREARTR